MGSDFKERLLINLLFLEENLQIDEIVDICYSKKVLTQNDRERIVAERSRPDKAIKFINILSRKKDKDYQEFLDALLHEKVQQGFVRDRLEATSVSIEFFAGHNEERLVQQIVKDCFEVKEGESCPAAEFLKYVKLMLRRQQKSLELDDNVVFKSATLYHPSVQLKKNRRKNVVAVQNLIVKSSAWYLANVSNEGKMHLEDILDFPQPVVLEEITPDQVAKALRCQMEKLKLDATLAERMEEEEVDGKCLSQFTDEHIKEIYPQLKVGTRIKFADAIRLTLEDLKKVPDARAAKAEIRGPKKLETYRKFDTCPGPKDVYEKGYVLPEEQSRPGQLVQAIHKYHMVKNLDTKLLAEETVKFAAACMNERVNGTIHFGVISKYNGGNTSHAGSIVGLKLDKQLCEVAITEEIYRAFYPDQREIALKCIRDPVYIPVAGKEVCENSELHVVEVDVVPHSEVVKNEAFFLNSVDGNENSLLRYLDGFPVQVTGKEMYIFMDSREKLSDLRRESEKALHSQPPWKQPDLHKKLHHLLMDGNEANKVDIYPLLFLSSCAAEMTNDVLTEYFECIKSLEPLAVFDFDPRITDQNGQPWGLYRMMELKHNQVYKVLTTDNFDKNSDENKSGGSAKSVAKLLESIKDSSFTSWIFCNGYEQLKKMELAAAAWRKERGHGFKEAVRFYSEQIPTGKARILIFLLSTNYDVLMGALEEVFVKFPDQWIIVADSEKIAADLVSKVLLRAYVEKTELEERTVIGMPWSHVNQSIMNIFGYKTTTGCFLPSSSGALCFMKENKRNELSDLEILSVTECKDDEFDDIVHSYNTEAKAKKKLQREEDFYRGKEVTWWNFWYKDHVLRRAQFKNLLEQVKNALDGQIPEEEKVAVITLLHQPGAGGTTTAREILWEMREKVRCCVIKKITDQTCDQIAKFRYFEEQDSPKPPLVLIDNEDEEKVFQLCSHMNERARREARDTKGSQKMFCVLIICIRMTAFPKTKSGVVMLGHDLQADERQWFQSKYQVLERRYHEKKGPHPKLLISFNILKENFNPDYIRRTVGEFVSQIKDFKERRLLKFISLINSFDLDFQAIPTSCFNDIMSPPSKTAQMLKRPVNVGIVLWEACLSQSLNILLNRTSRQCLGGDIQALRIINNNFSREILKNLRERDNQTVSDVALELLHCGIFKECNESSVQNQLVRIVKDMLKKRGPYKKGRGKFSPIVLAIGENEGYEKAAEVMMVGFDLTEDPMIAQQISRVYIHCQNWKEAEKFAKTANDMRPTNSYLCDTHGQVSKEKLIVMWQDTLRKEEPLEGDEARNAIDLAFQAIKIFRREQKLSDEDCTTGYNNCGFFQELRVTVTLLDICRFLKPFEQNKGSLLHKFLIDRSFIPEGLEELGQERIKMLKDLYLEYEKPMRRLEDEQIQLKEDSCYQYSPSYSDTVRERRMFVHLQECLDIYFGEESDQVPNGLSIEEACEYRRRRVKRKGGNSLRSIYGLRHDDNAAAEYEAMYKIIVQNVKLEFCNAFDLRTILNLTMAQISLNKDYAKKVSMPCIVDWTQKLYDKRKMDSQPYLEAFLYLVMFHWPTDWRNHQNLSLCSCKTIKDVIKEWKFAFQNNHPAQIEGEGKKPDRRKGTTLFFLGEGEGFDEIVFHSELYGFSRQQNVVGDSLWNSDFAKSRLKKLDGTLLHGGGEMSVTLVSAHGNATQIEIPTSFPIKDQSLWQKDVQFVLGFCWSGPKAFSVTRGDDINLPFVSAPILSTVKRYDHSREKMPENFWQNLFENQNKLKRLENNMRLSSGDKRWHKELLKTKEQLEKERQQLLQKRTSVLQGPY